jgi:hypothetical protein
MRKLLVSIALLFGCGAPPVTGDEGNVISPSDVPELRALAERGDLSAANTLAVYYAANGNEAEGKNWLRFAAERGDCNAIRVLIDDLLLVEGATDQDAVLELPSLSARHQCDDRASIRRAG